jgi:hypothetical protein
MTKLPPWQQIPPDPEELQRDYETALRKKLEQHGAAPATVEAVLYELRTYGIATLAGPNCRRRLADLSTSQLYEVINRLVRLRPTHPAITDELLFQLSELLS